MNKIFINKPTAISPQINNLSPKPALNGKPFSQVLDSIISNQDIKFSKHAMQRLEDRNIKLSNHEILRIKDALNKANQKGIKETLILMDDKAFVASVKNKTIITAAMDQQLKESIFTNIDGAVII